MAPACAHTELSHPPELASPLLALWVRPSRPPPAGSGPRRNPLLTAIGQMRRNVPRNPETAKTGPEGPVFDVERMNGIEPSTSTLARWRYGQQKTSRPASNAPFGRPASLSCHRFATLGGGSHGENGRGAPRRNCKAANRPVQCAMMNLTTGSTKSHQRLHQTQCGSSQSQPNRERAWPMPA
jgi:hypothetical protein